MTAPTIDTAPACPPDLPCPVWCDGSHTEDMSDPLFERRFHIRQGNRIEVNGHGASVTISAHDAWSPQGGPWERESVDVAVWMGGTRLAVTPGDSGLLRLLDIASPELGAQVREALVLALSKQVNG